MIPVFTVANAFIGISFFKKTPINAIRLQQLLYLANKYYIENERTVLFTERFVAETVGPSLQSIDYMFPDNSIIISDFILRMDGSKPSMDSLKSKAELAQILVKAWEFCENKSVKDVTKLLTGNDSGWFNCVTSNRNIISEEDIIKEKIG